MLEEIINNVDGTIVLDGQAYHRSYEDIYWKHDDNVSNKIENYFEVYDNAYRNLIGKEATILEIGVQNGGSLQIAEKYFINGKIFGIDVNPKVCDLSLGKNIHTYCFDATNKDTFEQYFGSMEFDTILDDGSHKNIDMITTFKNLFPKLKAGGVYIIEDLHCSYWPQYGGDYLKKDSAIEFLKKFVDLLHSYHIYNFMDREVDTSIFIKNLSEEDKYIFEWIKSISFEDGIAVIKKMDQPRKASYKSTISGNYSPVIDLSFKASKTK
jgi:hypothetical protein